jgi:hypothetical protein
MKKNAKNLSVIFLVSLKMEHLAKVAHSVILAKTGIQNCSKILDSGSRFACPE